MKRKSNLTKDNGGPGGQPREAEAPERGVVASAAGDAAAREESSLVADETARLAAQVESERQRLRNLVGTVPGVVWEAWGEPDDAAQRMNFVSDYVTQMLGYAVDEWLSTPNFWLTIVHPDDRERAAREAKAKFTGGGGVSEFRWIAKDGRVIPVEAHSVVVRDEAGQSVGMRGVTMDISSRKRADAELLRRSRQSALGAEVGVALAGGDTMKNILQRCAAAMVEHLDAALARVWTLEEEERTLELQASAGMYTHLDGAHGRVPVGKFKIGRIAASRTPHLTNSVVGDPEVGDQEWAKREGMVAFAGYPLIVGDRLLGVMAMFSRQTLADDMLETLASVANTVAQGVRRKRMEEQLVLLSDERERMLEEVSTPVVPVLPGVLVLPLIGSLDTLRMERATTAALGEVTRTGARVCIIDITGARIIDSHAVANLGNLVSALRLVGAEAIVTGIGAHAAQSLVGLGLDLQGMRTHRTLAQALAALINARGISSGGNT